MNLSVHTHTFNMFSIQHFVSARPFEDTDGGGCNDRDGSVPVINAAASCDFCTIDSPGYTIIVL